MEKEINTKAALEVKNLIVSQTPYTYIISPDEEQCIRELYSILCLQDKEKPSKEMFIWSSYCGLVKYSESFFRDVIKGTGHFENSSNPSTAISMIHTYPGKEDSIFIFRDFNTILTPAVARQLKDLYFYFGHTTPIKSIIGIAGVLGHFHGAMNSGVEPTLEKQISIVNWDLPTKEQIEQHIRNECIVPLVAKSGKEFTDEEVNKICTSLQGLSLVEINDAIAVCFTEKKTLDPHRLMQQKKQIILRSDILEYIESNNTMDDLGGLNNLKKYIKDHANSASKSAIEFGVDPLKGIVLVGIPGSGKSASAKAIGNSWGIPTLRLDVGKVMAGLVGASEKRMRSAIQQAKAVAPCVLWVDEIEKALSGTKSSNFSDGGTLSRVFGTLLTEMEEGLNGAGVVIVATANDISMLPPELIRRFSETFYVGLPTESERKDIWSIHLKRKNRDPKEFDLSKLAKVSNKFTGAEIEKALKEAISICFNDNQRAVTTEDIVGAIKSTKPLWVVMKEVIKNTEDWAKTRARFASSLAEEEIRSVETSSGSKISMDNLDDDDEDEDEIITKSNNQEVNN